MDDVATGIDQTVRGYLSSLDPVGIPFSFYIILIIGGLLACLFAYYAEVKHELSEPQAPQMGKGFKFSTLAARLVQSYTMLICCAYILHGIGFNLSLVAGISILASAFNKQLFTVLGEQLPEVLSAILNKYKQ